MAMFAVDGRRQEMVATGVVERVDEWAEVGGKRVRTDSQAVSGEGVPLWGVEVAFREVSFGRESTVTVKVQVPAKEAPVPAFMRPIVFEGLVAEARVNRQTGGLVTAWRAEAIAELDVTGPVVKAGSSGSGDVGKVAK